MQRSKRKAVTQRNGLPILIPCKEGKKADGWMTFAPAAGLSYVKVFGEPDFQSAFHCLDVNGKKVLANLELIGAGIRRGDKTFDQLQASAESVFPPESLQKAVREEFPLGIAKVTARQQALMGAFIASADPFIALSTAVSANLQEACLVLWWKGKPPKRGWMVAIGAEGKPVSRYRREMERHYQRQRGAKFVPAIFCLSMRSAFYAYLFFGSRSAAICPECQATFKRKRPDQTFCSPAHRDAHRVRRWRKRRRAAARSISRGKKK